MFFIHQCIPAILPSDPLPTDKSVEVLLSLVSINMFLYNVQYSTHLLHQAQPQFKSIISKTDKSSPLDNPGHLVYLPNIKFE